MRSLRSERAVSTRGLRQGARAVALALCCASACAQEHSVPATQFLVSVNSDLQVGTQLTRVEVRLLDVEGARAVEQRSFALTEDDPQEGQARLPFSFGISKGH